MKIKGVKIKKWTKEERTDKLLGLRAFEDEMNRIAESEIIKPDCDENLMKKIFYVQKLIKELREHIVMGVVRANVPYDDRLALIVAVLQLEMDDK